MSAWTPTDRRVGMWSAWAVVVLFLAYLATGAVWLVFGGEPARRDPFWPVDPYRAVLEALIILSAPPMVVVMAAVHAAAPPGAKACGAAALAFMTLAAGTTCGIHFVELTVVRRLGPASPPELSAIFFTPWPSAFFALDLLAWDLFLGLALLFAAPAFKGGGLQAAVRAALILGGTLCLVGTLGPALGDLRIQLVGTTGYAAVFPVACLLLATLFGRAEPNQTLHLTGPAGSGPATPSSLGRPGK
jgi:hypothetical protein